MSIILGVVLALAIGAILGFFCWGVTSAINSIAQFDRQERRNG